MAPSPSPSPRWLWLSLVCGSLMAAAANAKLADHFKVCSRSDPQVGQCIVDSLNGAREQLIKGIPELGLPPMDPHALGPVRAAEGDRDLGLEVAFLNSTLLGLGGFQATEARMDWARPRLELHTHVPALNFSGQYELGGHVLTLQIRGKGPYVLQFLDVNLTHWISFKETEHDGEEYWEVSRYHWDFMSNGYYSDYQNLFSGNKRLGMFANNFINTNWRPAWMVYKEQVGAAIGRPFRDIANELFSRVPLSQLFAP